MPAQLTVGALYSRDDVANAIGMPHERRGGNWTTGYDRWEDEFFVFCNVGAAGRTGHDYANRWLGNELIWFGKSRTKIHQPEISALVSGQYPVHVFWRGTDRSSFTYAGLATADFVRDTTPVEVVWSFGSQRLKATMASVPSRGPVWRRGPPPTSGEFAVHKQAGPMKVYLLTLEGPIEALFPDLPKGAVVAKIGISNAPQRRVSELNAGIPPAATVHWQLFDHRELPSGQEAFQMEGELLEAARLDQRWLGGEFIYLQNKSSIDGLFQGRPKRDC